jgi:dTDP-4-dehydrorhamnose 3,5-epimerase
MIFATTDIDGVLLITPERIADERGFFAKSWGQDDFDAYGLNARMVQRNMAYNAQTGTLRGMHFQRAPHAECKLISVINGAIWDVALDLRPDSPTCMRWVGRHLDAENGRMMYVPEGFAHGYVTLAPNTTVEYMISEFYAPQAADGVRWDDPAFGIEWPMEPTVVSERDRKWPDWRPVSDVARGRGS